MTLLETINIINYAAEKQPNINNIIRTGDVFDLNTDNAEQLFSAFCLTQRPHNFDNNFVTYNFTIYYVDRLTTDKSNKLTVQTTGCEILMNIMNYLNDNFQDILSNIGQLTTFTQKFAEETAGAFVDFSIVTTRESLCGVIDQQLGDLAPEPYTEDWFKFVINTI